MPNLGVPLEIAHRISRALEDMPMDPFGDLPFCQDVQVHGASIYVVVEGHNYAIDVRDDGP